MPDPVNSQPCFLEHIVDIGLASKPSCEKSAKLGAKPVYQGCCSTCMRLLVRHHEFLQANLPMCGGIGIRIIPCLLLEYSVQSRNSHGARTFLGTAVLVGVYWAGLVFGNTSRISAAVVRAPCAFADLL